MAVIVINVETRYLFDQVPIEFEELQWQIYSIGFMLTIGYALVADAHIRVHVFHERLSHRARLWIHFYASFFLPSTWLSPIGDPALSRIAHGVSVIWVIFMAVIAINVTAYLVDQVRIEFDELQWHLYSIGFMLTIGYALVADAHVRVDVLHERLSHRARLWIDFYGLLLLVVPFCMVMLWYGWDFFNYSFNIGESFPMEGGLPFRWFIKSFVVIGFALLLLAAISRLSRLYVGLFARGT